MGFEFMSVPQWDAKLGFEKEGCCHLHFGHHKMANVLAHLNPFFKKEEQTKTGYFLI